MATFLIVCLVVVGFAVLLGGAITFAYLCGLLGGGVVAWAFKQTQDGEQ